VNPIFSFLMSAIYDRSNLHPHHVADLRKSGLTDETVAIQKIRTVMPPAIFDDLLGFRVPAAVTSIYVIPFFDPIGTLTEHIRVKVFPSIKTENGTIKYLQPKRSGVRIFFPVATLPAVLDSGRPLYLVEGEKKALAVAQRGLPAVGFAGIEAWHAGGSRELLADFDAIPLAGRVVELVPDGDWQTNPNVERGVIRLAEALRARGAHPRLVVLPAPLETEA
jgi:hypothetical protein